MAAQPSYAVPYDDAPAPAWIVPRRILAALRSHGSEVLLGVVVAVVAIGLLELLPQLIGPDTWLALVAGRDIAHNGIPGHETLTVFAHGRPWIDQQWLAQLGMYELQRLGGLPLVSVFNVALIVAALGAAIVAARRLGASAGAILPVLPLSVLCALPAFEVRTEAPALPLFAGLVYLLARDARRPGRSVYWCLPLLVLWGNLHGSASMGAGLVVMRGLTLLWQERHQLGRPGTWGKPAALIVGGPLALLATPYGVSTISYYHATVLNGGIRRYVTEWQPVTAVPMIAIVFFLLAGFAVWSFGRHRGGTTLWERCALIALAGLAIASVRNVPWFGLAAIVVLPQSIDAFVRARARPSRPRPVLNGALAAAAAVGLIAAVAGAFAGTSGSLQSHYPAGAVAVVRARLAADPAMRVYADERFADWLLWRLPQLRGRIAYDARFELLSAGQLRSISYMKLVSGLDWKAPAGGYRLLVLDSAGNQRLVDAFETEPGRLILYDRDGLVVILRTATQARA